MRVVGYIRVSSKKQIEGYSLKLQTNKIKEYCKLMEYELVEIYEDRGISGMSLDKRDGFKDMVNYLKTNNIEGVVVYSLSRLGRKMTDVVSFLEVLKNNGKTFYSIKEGLSNDDKIGGLIMNILSSINQFEVEQIRERITDVKREKKSKGLVYGKPQYGWDNVEGKIVKNDKEFKVIKRIKNLRSRGHSWNKISIRLNDEGIPTKSHGRWNMGTLYNMMKCYQ